MWFRKRKIYFTNELPPPPVELIHWIQFGSEDMDVDLEEVTNKDKNDKIEEGDAEIICTGLEAFFRGLEVLFQCCVLLDCDVS